MSWLAGETGTREKGKRAVAAERTREEREGKACPADNWTKEARGWGEETKTQAGGGGTAKEASIFRGCGEAEKAEGRREETERMGWSAKRAEQK